MFKPLHNILIMIPAKDNNSVSVQLIPRLIKWKEMGAEINIITGFLVDFARNQAVRRLLEGKKKYILFVDSDTIPEIDAPQKLLKANKDVVGGIYNLVVDGGIHGEIKIKPSADVVGYDLQKVERIATGILLIKRDVFNKIKEPWFEFVWDEKHTKYIGEDYSFCDKAKQAGIEIWCDPTVIAKHSKTLLI